MEKGSQKQDSRKNRACHKREMCYPNKDKNGKKGGILSKRVSESATSSHFKRSTTIQTPYDRLADEL